MEIPKHPVLPVTEVWEVLNFEVPGSKTEETPMDSTASNFPGYFTNSDSNGKEAYAASFAASRAEHASALAGQHAARDISEVVSYNSKDSVVALLNAHLQAQVEAQKGFRGLERQVAQNRELVLALQLDNRSSEIRALDRATASSATNDILTLLKTIASKP